MQSHAPDYQYHITYSVEPMLEVLWRVDNTQDDTRYKVLFPITTPLMPRPPHIQDSKSHFLVDYRNSGLCKGWTFPFLFLRYCPRGPSVRCSLGYLPSWCGVEEHYLLYWGPHCWGVQCQRLHSPGAQLPQWDQELLSTSPLWCWRCPERCVNWQLYTQHVAPYQLKCFQWLSFFDICRILNRWLQRTSSLWSLGLSSCLKRLLLRTQWTCRLLCRMLVR